MQRKRLLFPLLLASFLAFPVWADTKTTPRNTDTPATKTKSMPNDNTARPLFFSELVAFSTEDHRHLTLPAQRDDYSFAASTHMVPLTIGEAGMAVHSYPMIFVREGNVFGLTALVGLPGVGNLFLDAQHHWREGAYIPAYVRSYPFIAVRPAPDAQPLIAFDPNAADFKVKGGQALIDQDGKPTERMQAIIAFQTEYQAMAERTRKAVDALQAAGVLEGGHLNIRQPNGENTQFDGFLVVNETKLRELKADALKRLMDADALGLAYAHLMSLSNLERIQRPAATTTNSAPNRTAR